MDGGSDLMRYAALDQQLCTFPGLFSGIFYTRHLGIIVFLSFDIQTYPVH